MNRTDRTSGRQVQYAGIGLISGAGVGVVIGALIGGWAIALGICIGAGIGIVVGAAIDAQRHDSTQSR